MSPARPAMSMVSARPACSACVDVRTEPLRNGIWLLREPGVLTELTEFSDETVVDIYRHRPTGELLFLTQDGAQVVEERIRNEWRVRIVLSSDLETFQELVVFRSDTRPASVAYWRGAIYYGTGQGQVWRSVGAWPRVEQ